MKKRQEVHPTEVILMGSRVQWHQSPDFDLELLEDFAAQRLLR
ncbi:MAG TPA: hypothetical protein PKW60_07445 [Candidatus Hydrogenedentes bacterium]|nr:hypothetical protein [Candidatus Hydrogenedentota bacterium]